MNINDIVEALDSEISRLRQVRNLLSGQESNSGSASKEDNSASVTPKKRGRPPGSKSKAAPIATEQLKPQRAELSPAAKERIAAAQRARWAKQKATDKKASRTATKAASGKVAQRDTSKSLPATKGYAVGKSKSLKPPKKGTVTDKIERAPATKKSAPASATRGAAELKASAPTKARAKAVPPRPSATRRRAEEANEPLSILTAAANAAGESLAARD